MARDGRIEYRATKENAKDQYVFRAPSRLWNKSKWGNLQSDLTVHLTVRC